METLIVVALAYLLGSVSFAVLVSRAMGLPDPRSYGSGNPGATNVLRTGKKTAAVLTLAGDAGKGWLAVFLAALYTGQPSFAGLEAPLAGLAAFLGHVFPVFHRFQGGKGVATAAGVLLAINVWLGLATLVTWVAIAVFFRMSSFAALIAALFAPAYAWWLFGLQPVVPVVAALALVLVWRHKANIVRILSGTEPRIGARRDAAQREDPPAQ